MGNEQYNVLHIINLFSDILIVLNCFQLFAISGQSNQFTPPHEQLNWPGREGQQSAGRWDE